MTSIVAAGYFSAVGRLVSEAKSAQDQMVEFARQLPGGTAETELTISAGSITPTAFSHRVDTEADAGSDNLDNIQVTNLPEGSLLLLRPENAARVVTVRHAQGGSGEIVLRGNADVTWAAADEYLLLERVGTQWRQVVLADAATATKKGIVELATGAETAAGSDATRAVTPSGLFATGAARKQGRQSIWVPAGALTPRTSGGAATPVTEQGSTNLVVRRVLEFADSAVQCAQISIAMPDDWNRGTMTAVFYWYTSVLGNCRWGIHAVAMGNSDGFDPAWGVAQEVLDGAATSQVLVSPETPAFTVGGSPQKGDMVAFEVYRDGSDATDTLGGVARLYGVRLFYSTNVGNED